jgi:hypothetical protein
MRCPKCQNPMECPCENCRDRLPEGVQPWRWIDGEVMACSACGFAAHADQWLYIEADQIMQAPNASSTPH